MSDISAEAINSLIFEFFSSLEDYQMSSMEDLDTKVMLLDDSYGPVSREDMLAIAKDNPLKLPLKSQKTDLTDCDDYALQLKAIATARARQLYIVGEARPLPPAVGIVICNEHVINMFVEQGSDGAHSICFMDASTPGAPLATAPEEAARIMKKPPRSEPTTAPWRVSRSASWA